MSMGCWIVASVPQFVENYMLKSSEGLAPAFVFIWVAGDLLNLLGSWWSHLLRSMVALAVYYVASDFVLVFQLFYYRRRPAEEKNGEDGERDPLIVPPRSSSPLPAGDARPQINATLQNAALAAFVLAVGLIGTLLDDSLIEGTPDTTWVPEAQVMGWLSACLYLSARIPQIIKNRVTHCEGLAPGMFVLSALGNLTYFASILVKSVDPDYLLVNASWIISSGGCVFLDFVVLAQFAAYARD
ncbi:hypothetical protein AURDEDRAFT_58138 [Auricularia subglabra TFB-10046 SS5]|nr:hypothetical protein AURDEDRAFT_58138 [Auricularia subglabra TFB-10046 SS5]